MDVRSRIPAVLRDEPQFRRLFAGQILSLLGDRVAMVALPFAVVASGGGATAVGAVATAQFLPFLILSLAGGVAGDRHDRRTILLASDAARLVCQGAGGALVLAGSATPAILGGLAALYGTADAYFSPALSGLLPTTIADRDRLQEANALRGLASSVASVSGPALAAGLVALCGAGGALAFDAASFAVSVVFLVRLRPAPRVAGQEVAENVLAALRAGWRAVASRSWVWGFLLALVAYHVIVLPAVFVLGPVLADRELGGAGAWAVVATGFGAGAIAGDLLLLRWRPRHAVRAATLCLLAAGLQAAIIGSGLPVAGIAAVQFVAGAAVTCSFSLWETSLQEHIPAHTLSRVSSYDYLASAGVMPIGMIIAGPISAALGLHRTLIAMSVVGIAVAAGALRLSSVRELGRAATATATATASTS